MTNTPNDKTPREVKIIESAEDGGFVAVYGTFSGIGTTKEDAYRELCVALSLATEVFEDELAAERQKADAAYKMYSADFEAKKVLTTDNERLKIKATNWEIVAAGFEEWAIHLRDEINEALSFGPTYKPELKGWVAQFVEWQKRMMESIWIKKPEALASPTKEPDPSKEPCPEDCDYEATHGYCPYKDHGTPHPPKGDSAGPEHNPLLTPEDEEAAREFNIRQAEQAVIEAARSHRHYVSNKGCMVCSALKALDRAKGKEDGK